MKIVFVLQYITRWLSTLQYSWWISTLVLNTLCITSRPRSITKCGRNGCMMFFEVIIFIYIHVCVCVCVQSSSINYASRQKLTNKQTNQVNL